MLHGGRLFIGIDKWDRNRHCRPCTPPSRFDFRTLGKAQVIGEIAGQAKIVSESRTGQVLGVHIIGPHATELIAEATLTVNKGLTVGDLAGTIHAHPTLSEIIGETALKAAGQPLHG